MPAPTMSPVRLVSFIAMTPLPPRPWLGNWSSAVRLPRPLAATTSDVGPGSTTSNAMTRSFGGQPDADDAGRGAAHRPDVGLLEPDRLALLGHEDDVVVAGRHA